MNIYKETRQALGRTQAQMAKILGVSLITWHRWEAGKTIPAQRDIDAVTKLHERYVKGGSHAQG